MDFLESVQDGPACRSARLMNIFMTLFFTLNSFQGLIDVLLKS